jgi:hypothetical protein
VPYLVGASLALAVGLFGRLGGFDRDRAFYSTVTIVVASYYALFAVMAEAMNALLLESAAFVFFGVLSVLGFKRNLWIVAGALSGHGVFDFVHPHLIANPGVPPWWPGFCGVFDVAAGAYLALLLARTRLVARNVRVVA